MFNAFSAGVLIYSVTFSARRSTLLQIVSHFISETKKLFSAYVFQLFFIASLLKNVEKSLLYLPDICVQENAP